MCIAYDIAFTVRTIILKRIVNNKHVYVIIFRIRLGYVGLGYIRPGPVIGGADRNLG